MFSSSVSFASRALTLAVIAAATLSAPAFAAPVGDPSGAASLSFTGGNGNFLTATLASPISYTITTARNTIPIFVFDGVGNVIGARSGTGSITYTVNGGTARTITNLYTGTNSGAMTADDAFMFSSGTVNLAVGDVLVLTAGSFTTSGTVSAAPPASATYNTFITGQGDGAQISSNGVSATATAPEPGTIALLLTAGVPVAGLVRRRKRSDIGK